MTTTSKDNNKQETLQEFLGRGGQIKKFEPGEKDSINELTVRGTSHAPPNIYNLSQGQFLFGEKTKRNNKKILSQKEVHEKLKEITGKDVK